MDLYGYCPRCGDHTSDFKDGTLCSTCEDSAKSGDELTRKVNGLLNSYALSGRDATLIEALQTENQRLREEISTYRRATKNCN